MSVSSDRATLINGLRDLADFLHANPDIPLSAYEGTVPQVTMSYFARGTDEQMRADIDRIAASLGTSIDRDDLDAGHYGTSISFGPVTYSAVGIFAWARAQYQAHTSYWGCVTPEAIDPSDAPDGVGFSFSSPRKRSFLSRLWPFSRPRLTA